MYLKTESWGIKKNRLPTIIAILRSKIDNPMLRSFGGVPLSKLLFALCSPRFSPLLAHFRDTSIVGGWFKLLNVLFFQRAETLRRPQPVHRFQVLFCPQSPPFGFRCGTLHEDDYHSNAKQYHSENKSPGQKIQDAQLNRPCFCIRFSFASRSRSAAARVKIIRIRVITVQTTRKAIIQNKASIKQRPSSRPPASPRRPWSVRRPSAHRSYVLPPGRR